tara:strand:- start:1070 stop:1363 length:294 start_codon:yes stop_codon:yes gene_type:complete
MILPNLCCAIRIEPGSMPCISVVVPHPSYLDEESWSRMEDIEDTEDTSVVVDCHTIELMRKYGYALHKKGSVVTGVELNCVKDDLKQYLEEVNEKIK